MNEKLKAIVDTIEAKTADRDKIVAKDVWTGDDVQAVKSLNAEIAQLHEQYELTEAAEKQAAFMREPANRVPMPGAGGLASTKDAEILAYRWTGYEQFGVGAHGVIKSLDQTGSGLYGEKTWRAIQENAYLQAYAKYLRVGEKLGTTAYKDIQEGLDPQGGYWAPPQQVARIISRMAAPTVLGGRFTTLTCSAGSIMMPKVNYADPNELYSTGFRVTYGGENPGADGKTRVDDSKLFGETRIEVFTAMMTTQIPRDFVEDSGVDIQGWITGKLAETVQLETDRSGLFGTGAGQPLGIIPAIGTFGQGDSIRIVKTGDANNLTADGVIKLVYSIPEQYIGEQCASVCNRTNTGLALRLLKDGNGRYLFGTGYDQSGLADERNPKLVGYDNIFSRFMQDTAANNYPLVFGDWSGYYHAVRLGLSIQVLQEKYAEQNRIGFVARFRHGGRPVEPWKLAAQKVSA